MNDKDIRDFTQRYCISELEYAGFDDTDYLHTGSRHRSAYLSDYMRTRQVAMQMPQAAFEHMVKSDNEADRAYSLLREEARIRERHPELANAYSQYKMLLELFR